MSGCFYAEERDLFIVSHSRSERTVIYCTVFCRSLERGDDLLMDCDINLDPALFYVFYDAGAFREFCSLYDHMCMIL